MASNPQSTATGSSGWNALADDIRAWLAEHIFAIVVTGVFVIANILRWVWRFIHHLPNTQAGLSLSFVEALTTHQHGAAPGTHGAHGLAPTSPDLFQQFEHLVASLFFVRTPLALVFYAVVILVSVGFAQSRVGVLRSTVLIAVNAVFGTGLGLLICMIINRHQSDWSWLERIPVTLTPITLVIGIAMACSAFESVMWRRRIVLLVYTFVGTAILFSGNPGDYCTLVVAVIGHISGTLMHRHDVSKRNALAASAEVETATVETAKVETAAAGQTEAGTETTTGTADVAAASKAAATANPTGFESHTRWWPGTDYEIRRLFAAIQVVFAVGPIISLTSRAHAGLLTGMGLFMSTDIDNDALLGSCENNHVTTSCIVLSGLHRVALLGLWTRILLPIAALLVVAWGLYHGRRLAAWVSMLFNTLTVLFAIIDYLVFPLTSDIALSNPTHHYALTAAFMLTTAPPLILAVCLLANLSHFPVKTARRPVTKGLITISGVGLLTGIAFLGFGLSWPDAFTPKARATTLLLDFLHRLLPVGFAGRLRGSLHPRTELASAVCWLMVSIFWVTVLMVFLFWFHAELEEGERGRERADRLVQTDGESMSFMTTWEGNRFWFSPSGRSAIAYRLSHGIALTVTGPFGDPGEYDQALPAFMRFCYEHSWSPAFYAVHDHTREQLEALGCSSIHVGTEMVVIPKNWQTRGKKWQDIRTAINKAKRLGITDKLTTFDQAGWQVQQQIIDISEQWASLKALPEMKFTLGGLEELRDHRVAVLYAVDADGLVQGVTSWLPTYRNGRVIGWTLDFMRHRTDSPNGIMEFLIARMAERLRDEGEEHPERAVEFMSLSAAPLAGMGQDGHGTADTAVIEHALQIVADYIEPAYGFKSLYFFKRKFQPETAPVYLCYPDSARLAQIGLAVLSSYVPELKPSQIVDMLTSMR